MTRVLVLGRSGQLARALAEVPAPEGWAVTFAGRDRLNLTRVETIAPFIAEAAPDVVINTAAYTAVDRAESEAEAAFLLNAEAPRALAEAAAGSGAVLLHLSTDYVFGGEPGAPFEEDAPTAPLQVYGASKAEGERRVLAACSDAVVVRTSWLLSGQSGFVRAILSRAARGETLRVVDDQCGNPTQAADLAAALMRIAATRLAGGGGGGLLHAAGPLPATWHELAVRLVRAAPETSNSAINAVSSEAFAAAARRPADSRLDVTKLKSAYGIGLRPWTDWITETARQSLSSAAIGVETGQQSGG